jgi:uncharacterized protein
MLNLYSLGMKKGHLYETIITTINHDGSPNAAPMGVICKESDSFVLHLHEGSKTIRNIRQENGFYVNLSRDPLIFVNCTIGNPSEEHFEQRNNGFTLKNADASFKGEVTKKRSVLTEDDLGKSQTTVIQAIAQDVVINKVRLDPLNRAICGIIEALVHLTRFEMASPDKKKVYLERIDEISRIVNRVGGKDHKKAMKIIKEQFP